ncbi:AMP-binding protein [Streptomyces sp. NPDC005784]|uniref:AMP-binding protein n=1 Tax=Streptomyces sp. NPDC005784 TaxID=3364731 RepID=UPI0036B752FC
MTAEPGSPEELTGLPPWSRVVVRMPSGPRLAAILKKCFDRSLVTVPLHPRTQDTDVAEAARRTSASLVIEDDGSLLKVRELDGDPGHPEADGLAFVIFTSGSTGRPKGVRLSRRAVLGNARRVAALHGFGPERPHGTCLPLFHVNALMMSLMGTLVTDAPLILCPRFQPYEYFAGLAEGGARTASIVPAMLHELLEDPPPWPESLDYLITAAAPLTSELAARFAGVYGPRLRQGYGLSEAVNFSFVTPGLDAAGFAREYIDATPPVGVPLPGTELSLVDGEVWIRTADRMSGYWEDPAGTAETITPEGWLRTGDLGELRDGLLVLRGRRKEVVNRGGEKHFPTDIERQWREAGVPGVYAAVPVRQDTLGQEIGAVLDGGTLDQLFRLDALPVLRPTVVATRGFRTTSTGKPQRLAMGRTLAAGHESAHRYRALLGYAREAALRLLDSPHPPACDRADRILKQAQATAALPPEKADGPRVAAHDALDALVDAWPALADGSMDGAALMRSRPGLWRRLMCEWPMGSYAELTAWTLRAGGLLDGRVLEVGTGVGNTTRLVAREVDGEFHWSDREPDLVGRGQWPGTGHVFDFDREPPASLTARFDTVFATNAVHCAADKPAALRRLHSLLAPGGRLVLGEGSGPVAGGPWALDFLFCAFDGWWDNGGFLTRAAWLRLFDEAGFTALGFSALRAGRYDLGGVVWGHSEDLRTMRKTQQ